MTNEEPKEEEKAEEEAEGKEEKKPLPTIELLEKIKAENDRAEKILSEQKEFAAKKLISGEGDAGEQEKPAPELSPKEYKDKVLSGQL